MGIQVNLATIAPAIKQLVAEGIRPQFEQVPTTYNMFGRGKGEFINGKGWRIGSELRPAVGVSGIAEGGSFNQPGAETLDDMYVHRANMSIAWEITGSVWRNAENESVMMNGVKDIIQRRNKALIKEANRQMFDSGEGARATYKSGTTTILCYNAIDHTPLAGLHTTKGARHLQVDERYDIYDSTFATLKASGVRISSKSNKSAVIAAAWGSQTDGDKLVLSNSLFKMPRGLPYHINNSGNYQLQSRTTYPDLNAVVKDNNSANLTVADFTFTKNLLISRAGTGMAKTVIAIMSLAQDNQLRNLGMNFKRWDGDAKVFDQSFDKFQHGDTVEQIDPDCGESDVWLTVKDSIKRYVEKELDTYNEDGNEMRMRSGVAGYGSDSFTGGLGTWQNFGSETPYVNALIKRCGVIGLSTQVADNAA
jgi:hypothetical protein